MLVREFIHDFLISQNVTSVFGVSGANIEDFVYTLTQKNQIRPILAKVESQACLMAMGAYLSTPEKLSVAFTTSGAGVLNTIPILAESFSSEIPFVLITGLIPQDLQGRGGFQDTSGLNGSLDIIQLLKPVCQNVFSIQHENEVALALDQCFEQSMKYKKPSVLLVPKNIFQKELKLPEQKIEKIEQLDAAKHNTSKLIQNQIQQLHLDINHQENFNLILTKQQIQKITKLKSQKKILCILGEQLCHLKNKTLIDEFIHLIDCQIAVTPLAKGFFNHEDRRFVGMTGVMGHEKVAIVAADADIIVSIGCRFDHLSRIGIEKYIQSENSLHLLADFSKCHDLDQMLLEAINALQ